MSFPLKWSVLAKIQNLKAVKSSYFWLFFVPVMAKMFANLEDSVNVTAFNHTFNLNLGLPFSWKIFYFSALFFAAANLLFLARCFSLIKDHKSFSDFLDQGKDHGQLSYYAYEVDLSLKDIGYESFDNQPYEFQFENKYLSKPFWILFNHLNSKRKGWRWTCSILYLIAFTLISIIIFQNFMEVMRFIY